MAAGAGLLYLSARRPRVRRTGQLLGASLMARGLTGTCVVKRAVMGEGQRDTRTDTQRHLGGSAGIHVRESIIIRRPVAEVYGFWRDLGNLARFLQHVQRVDQLDSRRSHWVVRGPGGMRVEWDAEMISDEPNELIAWQSVGDADVVSAGSVIFRPLGSEQTQVAVHLQYAPPGGRIGRSIAALLGRDPDAQVHDDLERLRTLLERREDALAAMPASSDGGHQPW